MKKITLEQFGRLFQTKEFKGQFDCFGTWNGLDMYELGDSPESAQNKMAERLKQNNWM